LNIIIANSNPIHAQLEKQMIAQYDAICLHEKDELTFEYLQKVNPQYIFFPHWSYIIPKRIYENFDCVVFHMTDLPFGRGGSPLQNLIVKGHQNTKISALKVSKGLDTGPIYLKRDLSLLGTAEEIFLRAGKTINEMIVEIIENQSIPVEQSGEVSVFKRRKPEHSNIEELENLEDIFDYIRMLDADGYPKAFIETEHFKIEFSRANLKKDSIIADVRITKK
jgi:methionyl-tRNA formyltransferase